MEPLPVVASAADTATVAMPEWDTDRLVTFSRSVTVDLTYRCLARCGYCEYRGDSGGLVALEHVDALLDQAVASHCREVLVMSGEKPWELADVASELAQRFPAASGEASFVDLAIDVCRR